MGSILIGTWLALAIFTFIAFKIDYHRRKHDIEVKAGHHFYAGMGI